MKYYAVYKGWKSGVFYNWEECQKAVYKYPNAKYKKFINLDNAIHFFKTGKVEIVCQNQNDDNTDDKSCKKENNIYIYTDGASSENGFSKSIKNGIGIYIPSLNLEKSINVRSKTKKVTNNICELMAIYISLQIISTDLFSNKNIVIYTDSSYSKLCCTTYGKKLHDLNWTSDVPNIKIIKKLYNIFVSFKNITINHIKAHTDLMDEHHVGNRIADRLAVEGKKSDDIMFV